MNIINSIVFQSNVLVAFISAAIIAGAPITTRRVGFGRRAQQIASRRANRIVRRRSRRIAPAGRPIRSLPQQQRPAFVKSARRALRRAAAAAALTARKPVLRNRNVVDKLVLRQRKAKPILRAVSAVFARPSRPISTGTVAKAGATVVNNAADSIIAALDQGRVNYRGNGRTCVGKKYKTKNAKVAVPTKKVAAKAARSKRCISTHVNLNLDIPASRLILIGELCGVIFVKGTLAYYRDGVISVPDLEDLHVVTHELVHYCQALGLTKDLDIYANASNAAIKAGLIQWEATKDYYEGSPHRYDEYEAATLMYDPELVARLLCTHYLMSKFVESGTPNADYTWIEVVDATHPAICGEVLGLDDPRVLGYSKYWKYSEAVGHDSTDTLLDWEYVYNNSVNNSDPIALTIQAVNGLIGKAPAAVSTPSVVTPPCPASTTLSNMMDRPLSNTGAPTKGLESDSSSTNTTNTSTTMKSIIEMLIPDPSTLGGVVSPKQVARITAARKELTRLFEANNFDLLPEGPILYVVSGYNRMCKKFLALLDHRVVYTTDPKMNPKVINLGVTKSIPYEADKHTYATKTECLVSMYSEHFLTKLATWSGDDLAALVGCLCVKQHRIVSVEGPCVVIKGNNRNTTFNFSSSTVNDGRQSRVANELVKVGGKDYSGRVALVALCMKVVYNATGARAILNEITNLWREKINYGAQPKEGQSLFEINRGTTRPIVFKPWDKAVPFLQVENTSLAPSDLELSLKAGIIAAPDKYNAEWIAVGKGAKAMFLGLKDDKIYSIHDFSKPTKVYNRPPSSGKYTRAEIIDRRDSLLRVDLGDGSYSCGGGLYLRTAFTNSRFGFGSGVAAIRRDLEFEYTVPKTITKEFHVLRIPSGVRALMAADLDDVVSKLMEVIEGKIEKAKGQVYAPGNPIISIMQGKYCIVKNETFAQDIRVIGGTVTRNGVEGRADSVTIRLETKMVGRDQALKLRGLGKKLTTLPYDVKGLSQPWDIILNNETTKGWPALIEMFAIEKGGCTYTPEGALLTIDATGEVIDLMTKTNAFTEWARAKLATDDTGASVKEVISFDMARDLWDSISPVVANDDINVIDINDTTVRIEETVEVIYGYLPYDIEIATPRESVAFSKMTMEQVGIVALQNRAWGEALMEEVKYDNVMSIVSMITSKECADYINISTTKGRDHLRDIIGVVNNYVSDSAPGSDRNLLDRFAAVYPNGVDIVAQNNGNEVSLHINGKALSAFGTFSGASATGIMLDLLTLLAYVTDEGIENQSGLDSKIYSMTAKVSRGLRTWCNTMVKSKGILKSMARAGDVVVGKIKTSYSPLLHSADGVPVILMHPDCPMVRMLDIEEGQIIGIQRTPMGFILCGRVKFSTTDAFVAHYTVNPLLWHAVNEGDADGDQCGGINAHKYGIDAESALAINASLMGMGGYFYCYEADDLPFFAFMSYEDKIGKKSLTKWDKAVATAIAVDKYVSDAAEVHMHYKVAVGVGYGICSALAFQTWDSMYRASGVDTDALKACVIAWRFVYESMGLGGYTPEAKIFMATLVQAARAWAAGVPMYKSTQDGLYYSANSTKLADTDRQGGGVPPARAIANLMPAKLVKEPAVIYQLIKARARTLTYGALERGDFASDGLIMSSTIYGAFRRTGQGHDPVAPMTQDDAASYGADEIVPVSVFHMVSEFQLSNYVRNPQLKQLLEIATAIHLDLGDYKLELAEAEDYPEF